MQLQLPLGFDIVGRRGNQSGLKAFKLRWRHFVEFLVHRHEVDSRDRLPVTSIQERGCGSQAIAFDALAADFHQGAKRQAGILPRLAAQIYNLLLTSAARVAALAWLESHLLHRLLLKRLRLMQPFFVSMRNSRAFAWRFIGESVFLRSPADW